jgi:hypothetical protein
MEKPTVDQIRNSGGMAEIGTKEDGAIMKMFNLNGRLIMIKERAIYETMMADDIDPDRTNIGLPPHIQRLLINKGTESEMASRTFLTAKNLFQARFFKNTIDVTRAMFLSLDLLQELAVLEKEINEYLTKEETVSKEFEERRGKPHSYAIPAIGDIESRCKTIFQKADHVEQILMEVITIFYSHEELTKQSHFPKFYGVLKKKYGEQDPFSEFIKSILPFMKVVRSLRNALDHRLDTVKVTDFEIQPDSKIISPTIELNHKEDKLSRESLSVLLPNFLQQMIFVFENTIAFISDKNARTDFMPYIVKVIPETKRENKFVKFCFWSPLGEGGFYHQ